MLDLLEMGGGVFTSLSELIKISRVFHKQFVLRVLPGSRSCAVLNVTIVLEETLISIKKKKIKECLQLRGQTRKDTSKERGR